MTGETLHHLFYMMVTAFLNVLPVIMGALCGFYILYQYIIFIDFCHPEFESVRAMSLDILLLYKRAFKA